MRDRHDLGDVAQRRARHRQEIELHREHDLPLHEQVGVEGQGVEGDVDGALDGVLDRHHREVGVAPFDRGQHVRDGAQRNQLTRGQVGLGEQSLLGEGAGRAEKCDAAHARAG